MAKSTPPPTDTKGELERASLALKRMRRELDKQKLPKTWRHWVATSLLAGETTGTETTDETSNPDARP